MTVLLRDYFAARAMQALLDRYGAQNAVDLSVAAFDVADEMLRERRRRDDARSEDLRTKRRTG